MNETKPSDLSCLSEKQREALDLLIKHMTSKQISRQLGISPHTVDQRIEAAKRKLGASSRSELALSYRELVSVCQQATYEESHIGKPAIELEVGDRSDPERLLIQSEPLAGRQPAPEWSNQRVQIVPKLFEGRWGILARIGAIAAIAFLIVASVLGGFAIYVVLSTLIAAHP